MWIRVSYLFGRRYPIVEFDRIYSSAWYELDTPGRAYRVSQLINKYSDSTNRYTHIIKNNNLTVSLAL